MSRTFADSLQHELENVFFSTDEFASSYTLSRGVNETTGVAAITAVRVYERIDDQGFASEIQSVDFDVVATAYEIDGEVTEPANGDRFGNGTDVWEVVPIGRRMCFEALDGEARVLRVHTRRVIRGR